MLLKNTTNASCYLGYLYHLLLRELPREAVPRDLYLKIMQGSDIHLETEYELTRCTTVNKERERERAKDTD